MSAPKKRPRLVNVHVIPWNTVTGLYGIRCDYDDGESFSEVWGSKEDCEVVVNLRRREIFTDANLKR